MVRLSQSIGSPIADGPVSSWPWYLVEACQVALQISHWQENLTDEDIPPENIWHHATALKGWFDRLKAKWKARASGSEEFQPVPDPESTITYDNSDILEQLRAP